MRLVKTCVDAPRRSDLEPTVRQALFHLNLKQPGLDLLEAPSNFPTVSPVDSARSSYLSLELFTGKRKATMSRSQFGHDIDETGHWLSSLRNSHDFLAGALERRRNHGIHFACSGALGDLEWISDYLTSMTLSSKFSIRTSV